MRQIPYPEADTNKKTSKFSRAGSALRESVPRGLTRYSTLIIKKAKSRHSSSSIKTKRKLWICLTDCFVFSCNGKEGQGSKATVLAAPGSPDTSVEHKGGGSVDPGSSRVP